MSTFHAVTSATNWRLVDTQHSVGHKVPHGTALIRSHVSHRDRNPLGAHPQGTRPYPSNDGPADGISRGRAGMGELRGRATADLDRPRHGAHPKLWRAAGLDLPAA